MQSIEKEKEQEIDLLALLQKIWKGRRIVLFWTIVCLLLGLIMVILLPKRYTATSVFVSQGNSKNYGGLGSLAALTGIHLNSNVSEDIKADMYPNIVSSIPFQRALIHTQIQPQDQQTPISYAQYYQQKPTSALHILKKYTIGLPSYLISLIQSGQENAQENTSIKDLYQVSPQEKILFSQLETQLKLIVNQKDNYITLSFTMEEPLAAAQMAYKAQEYLQKTITEFKIKKAQDKLLFIQQRYDEAEKDFKDKQHKLATFQDNNRALISSLSKTKEIQLQSEFNLSYNVYSELAKQLETQKIQVKEDTPIFTIIQPVSIPLEKSEPQNVKILIICVLLGVMIGIGIIFVKDFVSQFKEKTKQED